MPAVLNTNVASLWASKNLLGAQEKMANSVERLSSGLRINRARDDAAGLGIANLLTTQINGANMGIRNLNDAISMVQTAEGSIAAAQDMAQKILSYATQATTDTMNNDGRLVIKSQMQELIKAINLISDRTNFAGKALLDQASSVTTGTQFVIQSSQSSTDVINLGKVAFKSLGSGSPTYSAIAADATGGYLLTLNTSGASGTVFADVAGSKVAHTLVRGATNADWKLDGVTITNANIAANYTYMSAGGTGQAAGVNTAIEAIADPAVTAKFTDVISAATLFIKNLSDQRSLLGAYQNEIEYTISNVTDLSGNLSAAKSRVIDTDYAAETAALTKGQILQQAATAMLAQANQMPNVILTLLK
jgi:flagellin